MSELIQQNDNRATIRWKLLTTVSALVLTVYAASPARAEDSDRPLLWVELGGQMEQVSGVTTPVTAPFMFITPTPDVYKGITFVGSQKQARYSFGEEAKITFQPEDSDWNFSAGIRYGRSHANRRVHRQIPHDVIDWKFYYYGATLYTFTKTFEDEAVADTRTQNSESHAILDFTAGKDVGLGLFGSQGMSTINAGVRIASFKADSTAIISGQAINVNYIHYSKYYGAIVFDRPFGTFHEYKLNAQARRSFKGIGPALSWNASAAIVGNKQDGQLALDWGINAAVLFGKQRAKVEHRTRAYHEKNDLSFFTSYVQTYDHAPPASVRSRSVSVPNVGGFAGLSLQWTNAKLSIGYRYDTFLSAMDTGIDAAKKSNVTFNGPYATISVGLGD